MTTFSQWWKSFDSKGKVHAHYYVCGSERVLVDEVSSLVQEAYEVAEWNRHKFVVGVHEESVIWETLYSSTIDGGPALTVVTGANKLKNLHLVPDMIERKLPTHVVIFISEEDKIDRVPEEQPDGSRKMVLPEFLSGFEKRGRVIECIPFTQATAKVAVAWIQTKMEAKDNALVHLLNAANGDLGVVRDVVQKLKWLREPATVRNVNVFLEGEPSDTFTDALLAKDKTTAMTALAKIPTKDYLQLIGHLDAQVDLAGRVHDMLSNHKTVAQIMREVGSQAFLVPAISKVARHYARDRRNAMRQMLAEADRRLRRGTVEGVMESVVALW